jgi:hypothetical protein
MLGSESVRHTVLGSESVSCALLESVNEGALMSESDGGVSVDDVMDVASVRGRGSESAMRSGLCRCLTHPAVVHGRDGGLAGLHSMPGLLGLHSKLWRCQVML